MRCTSRAVGAALAASSMSGIRGSTIGTSRPLFRLLLAHLVALSGICLAQQEPTIRVRSELVLLDLVVLDSQGSPVVDLQKQEIELRQGGKKREIQFLHRVDGTRDELARGRLATTDAGLAPEMRLLRPTPSTPIVILVDLESTNERGSLQTRRTLEHFIRAETGTADAILLAYIKDGLHILHNFSRDRAETLRALERLPHPRETIEHGRLAQKLGRLFRSARGCPTCDPLSEALGLARDQLYEIEKRSRSAFHGLSQLAEHLSRLPGRKQLVLFGVGYPLNYRTEILEMIDDYSRLHGPSRSRLLSRGETTIYPILNASLGGTGTRFPQELREVVEQLNESQCAVYSIDPRGRITLNTADTELALINPGGASKHSRRSVEAPLEFGTSLAVETGGAAFHGIDDLDRGLREALRDSRSHYLVAFRPAGGRGKKREIEVRVLRKGVTVRHRKIVGPAREISDRVLTAFSFPGLFSEFPMEVSTELKEGALGLTVAVAADELAFSDSEKGKFCSLQVFAGLQDELGRWVNEKPDLSKRFDMDLTEGQWRDLLSKETVRAAAEMKIAQGAYRLVVVVRQRPSGILSAWSGEVTRPPLR